MRILPALILATLALGTAAGQSATDATPLTLEQALAMGPGASADVSAARSALATAERNDTRVASDPTSLRVDRITASNARSNAQHALDAVQASNALAVATAYFSALEADTAVSIAEADGAIQRQTLQAQEARKRAGAATDLDVAQAQNANQQAQATLADATTQRTLAYNTLASLLGAQATALAAVTETPSLAALDDYVSAADQANAQLVAARLAVTLAQAQLEAIDNDFSARADIQDARDGLANARRQAQETQRTLDLAVQAAHANAQAALAAFLNARAADATAQANLDTAKAQLDAGSISPLAFQNDQLTRQQAAQSVESARHTAFLRLYTLDQVVAGG